MTLKDPVIVPRARRGTLDYSGRVKSEAKGCVKDRLVTLYRKSPGVAVATVGSDVAEGAGRWTVHSNVNSEGKYYARIERIQIGPSTHSHSCREDRSNTYVHEA